jgi:tetratricopeptide (TPR) repeat protein
MVYETSVTLERKCRQGMELLRGGPLDKAEDLLVACDEGYERYFRKDYPDHIRVKYPLSVVYELKKDYEKAIRYRLEAIYYMQLEANQTEVKLNDVQHLVKVVELYLEMERESKSKRVKVRCASKAKSYLSKCWTLFGDTMDTELKVVTPELFQVIPRLEHLGRALGDEEKRLETILSKARILLT